jgi:hypothetical protein
MNSLYSYSNIHIIGKLIDTVNVDNYNDCNYSMRYIQDHEQGPSELRCIHPLSDWKNATVAERWSHVVEALTVLRFSKKNSDGSTKY